jgi:uncharacterized phosphosugar-binding protein
VEYLTKMQNILAVIAREEADHIRTAAELAATAVAGRHWVDLFGSGHSAIPALDAFPRYGSFVGFRPVLDPRLMWHVPSGPGGAPELLWLERQPGYIRNFLADFSFEPGEIFVIYSHGGLNAAPVETALFARERGLRVVAITSLANHRVRAAEHPSGHKLADLADVVLDTHVPPEDALIHLDQAAAPVGAGSTVAAVAITMALVTETARILDRSGGVPPTFVSPNVPGIDPGHNAAVYDEYRRWRKGLSR